MLNTASCPSGFRCISSCSLRAVSVVPSARRGCLQLLSCLDDPLALHDFLVEVDLWDFRDPFFKLQLFLIVLPLLDICIGSWMLRDWPADCSFSSVMYFPSYFSLSRSQSFGLLSLLLALLFSCSALLGSFHHFSPSRRSALLCERIVASMFFSLSLYPCCSFIIFSPLARRLWFSLGFSPLAPWLWLRLYLSLTTGFLAVALSLILSRDTLW